MSLPYRGAPWDSDSEVLLSDGAWGTELQRRGLPMGALPDEWSLSCPERVAEVARSYVEAGARVVETNTFGASRISLARHGLDHRAEELNERAAALTAREARGAALTAGSIGPSGKLMAMGEVSEQELQDAFAEQARGLAAGGAEWIVVESMFDAAEMVIAVRAAKEATGLPIAASMTYNPQVVRRADRSESAADPQVVRRAEETSYRTMMGDTVADCARRAEEAGATILGTNCGHGVETFPDLVRQLRACTRLPVWVYANAGLPRVVDGKAVYEMAAEAYANAALVLADCGASIVGGCCGTTPAFIRAMAQRLDARGAR